MHHDKACRAGKPSLCCKFWTTHGCARAENTAGSQAHGSINVQEAWRLFIMLHYVAWLGKFCLSYSLPAEELNTSRVNGTSTCYTQLAHCSKQSHQTVGYKFCLCWYQTTSLSTKKKKHFCPPVLETWVKHSHGRTEGARLSSDSLVWMKKIWSVKK